MDKKQKQTTRQRKSYHVNAEPEFQANGQVGRILNNVAVEVKDKMTHQWREDGWWGARNRRREQKAGKLI